MRNILRLKGNILVLELKNFRKPTTKEKNTNEVEINETPNPNGVEIINPIREPYILNNKGYLCKRSDSEYIAKTLLIKEEL